MHKYSRCLETKSFSFSCTEIFNLSLSQKKPKNKTKPQAHPLTHKHLTSRAKHTFNLPWTYFQTLSHKESARSVLSYRKEVPTFSYKCSTSQTKKTPLLVKKRGSTSPFRKCSSPFTHKSSNAQTNARILFCTKLQTLSQIFNTAHTLKLLHNV